jgi:hypothetical protein
MSKKIGFSPGKEDDNRPTIVQERDEYGLLPKSLIEYLYDESGSIDWRKMVKQQYLVSNRDRTSETDVCKLEDRDLLILLGGIKELAQIRGYTSVSYQVSCPSADYVVAVCTIDWVPNFETGMEAVSFSAIGDASPNNTKSFAKHFLGPIAENRAFVRCVRNFLKIHIVSQEEMGNAKLLDEPPQGDTANPKALLSKLMSDKNITFDSVKTKLVKEGFDKAESLNGVEDIPVAKCFALIERIKKARKKKAA